MIKIFDAVFTVGKRGNMLFSFIIVFVILAALAGCFVDPDMSAPSVGVGFIFGLCFSFFVWSILHYFFHRNGSDSLEEVPEG